MLGCQVLSNTLCTCFVIFGFFSKVVYLKKDTISDMVLISDTRVGVRGELATYPYRLEILLSTKGILDYLRKRVY